MMVAFDSTLCAFESISRAFNVHQPESATTLLSSRCFSVTIALDVLLCVVQLFINTAVMLHVADKIQPLFLRLVSVAFNPILTKPLFMTLQLTVSATHPKIVLAEQFTSFLTCFPLLSTVLYFFSISMSSREKLSTKLFSRRHRDCKKV